MGLMGRGTAVRRAGAIADDDGTVRWRVWAPSASVVTLVLIDERADAKIVDDEGVSRLSSFGSRHRSRRVNVTHFDLTTDPERNDPCSRWQPEGVDGPSAVFFPQRFSWTDQDWRGVPRADLVFYEIHTGTFTPEGTFDAIIPRLKDLRELGITAIEIMPVGQFPGSRSWGLRRRYYTRPGLSTADLHGLQRLIDACRLAAGLAIYLDVVYNHFGPESNYLGEFGPYFADSIGRLGETLLITTTPAATPSANSC